MAINVILISISVMKKMFFLIFLIFLPSFSLSFECKVCHSKNPKMINMHKALNFKDCFTCHKPGGIKKSNLSEQKIKDEKCIKCHTERH